MNRLDKLKKQMAEKGIEAAIVSSNVNIRYMTGLDYTDGFVLITKNKSYVLTDFRYVEIAKMTVDNNLYTVVMPEGSMKLCILNLLAENDAKIVAYEDSTLPCAELTKFKKVLDSVELVPGLSEMIDGLRLHKDAGEIESMKKAQAITDAGFVHMLEVLNPNMTEIDAALELEFFMRKLGSEGTAFDTIAVSGKASSLPHGVPRNVKLEKGFFTMDFGAKINGYCSDMTRTVVLGKADEKMKHVYETVKSAQLAALDFIHEGIVCAEADKVARDIIYKAGYEGCFGHGLGHGVGLYIHEYPRLSKISGNTLLERGHVVTVEPGIYIEGQYGCRIEDMVGVMEDGSIYNFTHSSKEMIELF